MHRRHFNRVLLHLALALLMTFYTLSTNFISLKSISLIFIVSLFPGFQCNQAIGITLPPFVDVFTNLSPHQGLKIAVMSDNSIIFAYGYATDSIRVVKLDISLSLIWVNHVIFSPGQSAVPFVFNIQDDTSVSPTYVYVMGTLNFLAGIIAALDLNTGALVNTLVNTNDLTVAGICFDSGSSGYAGSYKNTPSCGLGRSFTKAPSMSSLSGCCYSEMKYIYLMKKVISGRVWIGPDPASTSVVMGYFSPPDSLTSITKLSTISFPAYQFEFISATSYYAVLAVDSTNQAVHFFTSNFQYGTIAIVTPG